MKKLWISALLFLNSLVAISNPLVVGAITGVAPFSDISHTSDGTYFYGFSIDMMNAICQRIQQKCIFSPLTLTNQFEQLDRGAIDLLLLASPYTGELSNRYIASLPYVVSRVEFVTLKSNSINRISDIKQMKIGVIKTTFYELFSQTPYAKNNKIVTYNIVPDLLTALMQKKVDVIILNSALAWSYINNDLYSIKTVGNAISLGAGYGIVSLKKNAELIEKINKAILSIQADGTYVSIYSKYYKPS